MMDRKSLEIMAPAGNFECLSAAIQGGADSVYFGVENLNMRSHSANNFSMSDLPEICRICRENGVKSYLTLNIVLYQDDMEDMRKTLDAAKEAGITADVRSPTVSSSSQEDIISAGTKANRHPQLYFIICFITVLV